MDSSEATAVDNAVRDDRPRWLGGYVREGKRGDAYIIERFVNGRRFHVSTGCRTERAALKELEIFEEDPVGYKPHANVTSRLLLTPELVLAYRDWMISRPDNPTSVEWAKSCARFLADWILDLGETDLRHVSVTEHLKPALAARKTCRMHRIEVIKAFYGYLRKERGLLKLFQDPTGDLPVPKAVPAKHNRKRVVERASILKVLPFLPEKTRDVLVFQCGTAWHISEVRRFAKGGEILRGTKTGELARVVTLHKSKRKHITALQHREHLEAAQRIKARGRLPKNCTLQTHMKKACEAAGVEQFRLGVMRHTVLTSGRESGASRKQISEFAGHRSQRTTDDFYIDTDVAPDAIPVIQTEGKSRRGKKR